MTSVRDLLDVAAAELDGLSCRLSLGDGPSPDQLAEGWALLLPAGQHLIRHSVGPYTKVHRRTLRQLNALVAPTQSNPTAAPAAIVRAASAMGAAGDLLTTAFHHSAAAERLWLLDETTRLLTASAEVTLHGVASYFEHSATMASAADAGGMAHRLGRSAMGDARARSRTLEDIAVPAPALPLTHPLGRLAQAVHEWTPIATGVVDKPAVSSHDLRGVALVAGQLTATVRCLLAVGPPDATSPADELLDRFGRAWSDAARQWTRYAVPGAADRELATVSWLVTSELQRTLVRGGRLASVAATDLSITPTAAARLRRSIMTALRQVADAHFEAVARAAQTGSVAAHTSSSLRSVEHLSSPGMKWLPARPEDLHPLVSAYGRIVRTRPRDASTGLRVPAGSKLQKQSAAGVGEPTQVPRSQLHTPRGARRR